MSEHLILHRTWDFQIHFDGEDKPRAWELERPNRITQKAYAKHLSRLALGGINANRDMMDDLTHTKAVKAWTDGYPKGEYNWQSRFFWDTLDDQDNRKELLLAWIQQAEAKAKTTEAQQTTREQIEAAWDIVTGEGTTEAGEKYKRTVGHDAWLMIVEMLTERNPTVSRRAPEASA